MKKILIAFVVILLIGSLLFSCGTTTPVTPPDDSNHGTDPDDPQNPGDNDPTLDPTDGGSYMKDAIGVYVNGTDIRIGTDFLTQVNFGTGNSVTETIIQNYRDAQIIIDRGHTDVPVYGIYSGAAHEYLNFYGDLAAMGITNLRTNYGGVNDTVMEAFCESNISVMLTAGTGFTDYYTGSGKINTNPDLLDLSKYNFVGYLEKVYDNISGLLSKYGPDGSFFDTYDGNYNPIRYIEVQNEPNFQYLFAIKRPGGSDDANNYMKSCVYALEQIVTYYTVKSLCPDDENGNPTVYVVGMGAGGVSGLDRQFLEDVLKMDNTTVFQMNSSKTTGKLLYDILNESIAASEILQNLFGVNGTTEKLDIDTVNTMDILSTHPYIDGKSMSGGTSPFGGTQYYSVTNTLYSIRSILGEAGRGDLPIWFTECGWNISEAEGALKGDGPHTQLEQAEMEVQYYLYAIRNGVDRITYMSIIDTDGCNYGQFQTESSAVGAGGANNRWVDADWRLCCYAIQTMTTLLPNPALKKIVREKPAEIIYELIPDIGSRDTVTVVLSPESANTIAVPWNYEYALVTDLFGATKLVAASNGNVTVDAGPALLYLQVPTMADLIANGVPVASEAATLLPVMWIGEKTEY